MKFLRKIQIFTNRPLWVSIFHGCRQITDRVVRNCRVLRLFRLYIFLLKSQVFTTSDKQILKWDIYLIVWKKIFYDYWLRVLRGPLSTSVSSLFPWSKLVIRSIGRGNMTVEFFSADIEFSVWIKFKYYLTIVITQNIFLFCPPANTAAEGLRRI